MAQNSNVKPLSIFLSGSTTNILPCAIENCDLIDCVTSVRSIDFLFQWLTRHCLLVFVLWFEISCCSLGFLKYRARKEALRCVARGCRSDYLSAIVGPIRPENRPIRQNQVQIDTTQNFSRILIEWALLGSSFAIDRTLVM